MLFETKKHRKERLEREEREYREWQKQEEEKLRLEHIKESKTMREIADYIGETVQTTACYVTIAKHKLMLVSLYDSKKRLPVYHSNRNGMTVEEIVMQIRSEKKLKGLAERRKEEIEVKPTELKIKKNVLTSLSCTCCGGTVNRNTLICDYCGTQFILK